jgi:dolichyl-phosphate-mannose-protein mannosyltransferase
MPLAPSLPSTAPQRLPRFWFRLGMVLIFLISVCFRFWGLSRFNTLVFDEVYYAKFAAHFLQGKIIFTGHPPLSTYIVAIGIWLGERMPWVDDLNRNGLSGLWLSTWSYRWLNALTGAFIPWAVGAIAYHLSRRYSVALIAAALMAMDGLFLVESRYALNNVYLILFGLLGNLFLLKALEKPPTELPVAPMEQFPRWQWLALSGIFFGASGSIKWNGLWLLLGLYLLWGIAWVTNWFWQRNTPIVAQMDRRRDQQLDQRWLAQQQFPLFHLHQINPVQFFVCFACIPVVVYYLSWLPYIAVDVGSNFWQLQVDTLDYHHRVGGLEAHRYCSQWFTWMFMLRPIAYFYEMTQPNQVAPVYGPPSPNPNQQIIYDVHAMGNPFLYWVSTAAIAFFIGWMVRQVWQRWIASNGNISRFSSFSIREWIGLYLVVNWIANLLPWVGIKRCAFLYHYMACSVFAALGLAFLLDHWLRSDVKSDRQISYGLLVFIAIGLLFWMPLYLGLPLSPEALQLRRWLPGWT